MKKEWKIKRLGDVCELATGGTPSRAKPEYFGGNIRWLVSGDIHQGEIFNCEGRITEAGMRSSNAKMLPINSVMIALNGQGKTRGTVALLRTPATCNQSLVCITPKSDSGLLPEFLYSNLHGRYEEIRHLTSDDDKDRRGLNMGIVRGIQLPIPPIPEQKRIVGVLDQAFEGIAAAVTTAENNLRNARALFDSHLQTVFTQKGQGWVEKKLGNATGGVFTGPFGSLLHKSDYIENGIPLVNPAHISSEGIEPDFTKTVSKETAERLGSYIMRKGDVVIGRRGEMGRCAVITDVEDGWLCGTGSFFIKSSDKTDSSFLVRLLRSAGYRAQLEKLAGGAVMPNLSNSALADLSIRLPSLDEQKTIVALLDALAAETQKLERIYERKLTALAELKKSLLHQAFAGNL